jgi:hypothetical protein
MNPEDEAQCPGQTPGHRCLAAGEQIKNGWIASKPARIALVVGLLAIGAALRLIYARGLPVDFDQELHLAQARKMSLSPGAFYFPLAGPDKCHPALVVWLTAAANWAGRGNLFAIRVFFVFLHVVGLAGLYRLAGALFGCRVAVLALALATIDRNLITASAWPLEPYFRSLSFLVPGVACGGELDYCVDVHRPTEARQGGAFCR